MSDQDASQGGASPTDQGGAPQIERLSAAVVTTDRRHRGKWLFVGWTTEGLPFASYHQEDLTEQARESALQFVSAGLDPRRVPYSRVRPVEYVLTGPAIDFADTPARRAEDHIRYTVTNADGERIEIALGELALLGAIVDARVPWQASSSHLGADFAVSAVPLYTVFVPPPGAPADSCVGIVFRSTFRGAGNEPAFRGFVRQTLGRLLVVDESQSRQHRKGYLLVAGRIAGIRPKGGLASTLLALRRIGLVDFSDQWIRSLGMSGQRAKAAAARMLRAVGMADVSDEALERMMDVRPDYDVDPLETEQLIALAEGMYKAARRALRE